MRRAEQPTVGRHELARRRQGVADRALAIVAVVGEQDCAIELALGAKAHVSELRFQPVATLADEPRAERGVVVGRQVQVVGHGQIHAALPISKTWKKKTACSSLAQRQAQIGRVEDGHVVDGQPHMASSQGLVVDVDGGGREPPCLVVGGAAGEPGIGQVQLAAAFANGFGLAAHL